MCVRVSARASVDKEVGAAELESQLLDSISRFSFFLPHTYLVVVGVYICLLSFHSFPNL